MSHRAARTGSLNRRGGDTAPYPHVRPAAAGAGGLKRRQRRAPPHSSRLATITLLAVALAGAGHVSRAHGAGEPDLSLLAPWLAAQTNLHTWSAEFVQTRMLKALAQPLVATGHVWFAAPNRFRWELGVPPQTIAIRQSDQIIVRFPKLRRAERYPLTGAQPGSWREALTLFEAGFPRNAAALESQFTLRAIRDTNGVRHVLLESRSPGARRLLPQIEIGFAAESGALRSTWLTFADGSTLQNVFTNAVVNPVLDHWVFDTAVPPDYKIVEPWRAK